MTNNKSMSSAEFWGFWFGVVAVGLTALGAIAGVVAWYFAIRVGRESAERTANLEIALSEQKARTAEATERAVLAESGVLRVRAAMADRRLSEAQQQAVTAALKSHSKPGFRVWIRKSPGDDEAHALALDIKNALVPAGIDVIFIDNSPVGLPGINLACGETEGRDFALALGAALSNGGLTVAPFTKLGCGSTTDIYLGPKPAARVGE